jgi:hypothetical protein
MLLLVVTCHLFNIYEETVVGIISFVKTKIDSLLVFLLLRTYPKMIIKGRLGMCLAEMS